MKCFRESLLLDLKLDWFNLYLICIYKLLLKINEIKLIVIIWFLKKL